MEWRNNTFLKCTHAQAKDVDEWTEEKTVHTHKKTGSIVKS